MRLVYHVIPIKQLDSPCITGALMFARRKRSQLLGRKQRHARARTSDAEPREIKPEDESRRWGQSAVKLSPSYAHPFRPFSFFFFVLRVIAPPGEEFRRVQSLPLRCRKGERLHA